MPIRVYINLPFSSLLRILLDLEGILESLVVLGLVLPVVILLGTHMLQLFFEVLLVLEGLMPLFWVSLCW